MSLKEDIKEIVLDAIDESVTYAFQGKVFTPRITDITNDIISKIEKRIDERIDFITETFFGHHTILIAKKVELEYVKEMIKS